MGNPTTVEMNQSIAKTLELSFQSQTESVIMQNS